MTPDRKKELDFLRDAATLLADAKDYLLFGEMLRPMNVDTEHRKIVLKASDERTGKMNDHLWQTPNVIHAAYRAADGSIGCVYVNIAKDNAAFSTEIRDPVLGTQPCSIFRGRPGKSQALTTKVTLPHRLKFELAPREILFIQVHSD